MKKPYFYAVVQFIFALLLLALGIFTFFHMEVALTTFVYVYGIASLLMGISGIIGFILIEVRSGWNGVSSLIFGILNNFIGIAILSNVWAGMFTISFLFPFWLLFMCFMRLSTLDMIRELGGKGVYWFTLIVNVLGLLAGFALLFLPGISLVVLNYCIGIYLILTSLEMAAFSIISLRS